MATDTTALLQYLEKRIGEVKTYLDLKLVEKDQLIGVTDTKTVNNTNLIGAEATARTAALNSLSSQIQLLDGGQFTLQADIDGLSARISSKNKIFYQDFAPVESEDLILAVGDVWIDTDDKNKLYVWNDTSWESADNSDIALSLSLIEQEQITRTSETGTLAQNISTVQAIATFKNRTYSQDTAPAQPAEEDPDNGIFFIREGDLWIDTNDDNTLYRWNNTSSSWEVITNTAALDNFIAGEYADDIANLGGLIDQKIETWFQASDPSTAWTTNALKLEHDGDLWYNTDDKKLKRYLYNKNTNVASWENIEDQTAIDAADAASAAQATADGKIVTFAQIGEPEAEGVGDLWIDTDDNNKLYRWNGTSWIAVSNTAALDDFIVNTYTTDLLTINGLIDQKIETWFQTTDPSTDWDTDVLKQQHDGDLWYDSSSNKLKRYERTDVNTGQWVNINDQDAIDAAAAASAAQDTADGKIVTFAQASQPTAEGTGDLWIDTDDNNKLYRWNGSSWLVVSDTAALDSFITNTYSSDLSTINGLIDQKAETWFQTSDPSTAWTTDALKQQHDGDLWYDTDDKIFYRYVRTAVDVASWQAIEDQTAIDAAAAASAAQDTADGKIVTFAQASQPTAEGTGDLWIDTDDNNKFYRWNGTNWIAVSDIAALSTFITNTYETDIDNLEGLIDQKIETWFQTSDPSTAWTTDTLKQQHDGDLWYDTTNKKLKRYERTGVNTGQWINIEDQTAIDAASAAATAQDTADGKIVTFAQASQPTAEGVGDIWIDTDDNNKFYRWNGSSWAVVSDTAALDSFITDTYSTDIGDLSDLIDQKIETWFQTSDPSTAWTTDALKLAHDGDLWYDTDDKIFYRYKRTGTNTGQWQTIEDITAINAASAASAAQSTADGKIVTFAQASAPTAEGTGDLWIDTDDNNKPYRWNGSSWVAIRDTSATNALTTFITDTYATDISNLEGLIDQKIETWFQASDPSTGWTTDALKQQHNGDLWYDTDDKIFYRYVRTAVDVASWQQIEDQTAIDAADAASAAQATADGKIVTFAQSSQPTAEGAGDLWIDTDDNNKLYRWNGSSWLAVSDTAALTTFIGGTYATDISDLEGLIDQKIETWFQTTDPSTGWTTDTLKQQHDGDLWYDTDDKIFYRYKRTGVNTGQWQTIEDATAIAAADAASTAQATADGKIVTFAQASAPTAEGTGDLWIDTDDNNKLYRWNGSSWIAVNDTAATNALSTFISGTYATDISDLEGLIDQKIETWFQTTDPSTSWTTDALKLAHDGDLWYDTDDKIFYRYVRTAVNVASWQTIEDQTAIDAASAASAAQATADGKIVTFAQTSQPSAEGVGDLWIDTDDNNKLYRWNGSSWAAVNDTAASTALSTFITNTYATDIDNLEGLIDQKIETWFQSADPSTAWNTDALKLTHNGDLWYDTDDKIFYRYIRTGVNTGQWQTIEDATAIAAASAAAAAQSTADGKIVTFAQIGQPTAEGIGDLWIDTNDDNKLYRWNGTNWISARDGTISQVDARVDEIETAKIGYATKGGVVFDNNGSIVDKDGVDAWNLANPSDLAVWNVGLPLATAVKSVAINNGSATLTVEQSFIAQETTNGELFGKYGVKIDNNGNVSGFGLLSTANNATPFSEFKIAADKFSIGPPVAGTENTDSPFFVLTTETVVNGITLQPGTYIKNGFISTVTANQIDTRNLTIKDASGNIVFSAGNALDWSNISTSYPTSISNDQITLSGLGAGAFATLSQINSSNISTYIASAAISNAYIADAAITNAKIGTAEVNTLKIAGNSVTTSAALGRTNTGSASATVNLSAAGLITLIVNIRESDDSSASATLFVNSVNVGTVQGASVLLGYTNDENPTEVYGRAESTRILYATGQAGNNDITLSLFGTTYASVSILATLR